MNEPKTPNLGLNKIDRSSPSTTYFDLDKYLDQNWEKVDDFAEEVEEKTEKTAAQVSGIQERLDTEKRRSVTLEPGLQIINAERASPFKLEGLKGRTLVNLLGRAGGCESTNGVNVSAATVTIDTSDQTSGSASLRVTAINTTAYGVYFDISNIDKSKYYIALASIKSISAPRADLRLIKVDYTAVKSTGYFTNTSFQSYALKISPTDLALDAVRLYVRFEGRAIGESGALDSVRLYEISESEYVALGSLTPEQVATRYPYVDSVQPARNPYAIRYGENLLPPFYEWTLVRSPYVMTSPYTVTGSPTGGAAHYVEIDVIPNTDYIFSVEHNGNISVYTEDGLTAIKGYTTDQSINFNSGNNKKIRTYLNGLIAGTFTFKNPMLMIGTIAKPFKPREDAMLALQTELYADPITGANADEVFEKDGQYFKLAKWKKVVLDGSINWSYSASSSAAGYKGIAALALITNFVARSAIITKYNGALTQTKQDGQITGADQNNGIGGGNLYLTVPTADSGWGDAYTPTPDEIKAYFMGWFMYTAGQNPTSPAAGYNGSGTKVWTSQLSRNPSDFVSTVPTTQAPNYTPYQLVYQLATPTVEPITSEGQLTLIEGNNQVGVGSGLVVRENIKPVYWGNTQKFAYVNRVGSLSPDSPLKNKAKKIIRVYKDNKDDTARWTIISDATAYGIERATYGNVDPDYDPSATYTVTYFMLDTFPGTPFVGSVAENEKALLTDLVQDVQQANARLSVVENKKAEKEDPAPAWITPTLLNGWLDYGAGSYGNARYYKDSFGRIYFDGLIKSGIVGSSGIAFKLPKGYIPARTFLSLVQSSDGTSQIYGRVDVKNTGEVVIATGGNGWVSLADISFLAEQ